MKGDRPIPLSTFAGVQNQDGKIDIVDGADGNPQVIVSGRTRDGQKVEWLRPGEAGSAEQQIVQRFLASISDEYGPRITRNIASELGLESVSGGLETHFVREALRMAESQRDVFSGANFFVDLHCSAEARTPAFLKACAAAGIDTDVLAAADLKAIEQRFRAATATASQQNREPLSTSDGERMLGGILNAWLTLRPPERT